MELEREVYERLIDQYTEKRIVELTRWYVWTEYISELDGKFYRFTVPSPATELQECDPPETVDAVEVRRELVPTMVWVPVNKSL